MKKYILSFAMMVMGASLLTSCLNDNDNNNNQPVKIPITTGLYVVNNGQWNKNNGSLTYFDYTTLKAQQLFSGVGELGDTPNDAYTKGDTIFIVVSTDNMIVAYNKKTNSVIDRISTTDEMGATEGYTPRHIIGYGDNIFFTTYGGYVARLDAKTLTVTDKAQVGSAPEGLTLGGTQAAPVLYVCNSDYGYGNASISKIPLASNGNLGKAETITNENIRNPQDIVAVGDALYYLDWGHYTEDYSKQLDAGLYYYENGISKKIIENATGWGVGMIYVNSYVVGYNFVTFNDPYGNEGKPTYSMFNTYTRGTTTLTLKGDSGYEIFSPAAIGVDPLTGNIVIASRSKDPDTGYASYTLPGYANIYNSEGNYIKGTNFQTGIEPHAIGFTIGSQLIGTK